MRHKQHVSFSCQKRNIHNFLKMQSGGKSYILAKMMPEYIMFS